MSYLDRYKKRAGKYGTTQNEIMRNHAVSNLERNFSHIVGSTPVLVNGTRETEMIIESSADDLTKKAIAKPSEVFEVGDYLRFNSRLWLIQTINTDLLSTVCQLLICNQQMNAPWFECPIACHANNTTYGSKGLIDNGSKFLELDAKTKIYIQKNEFTDRLYLGYRFILNHRYVYRITEIENTIYGGIYVITSQMDESNDMDDFENNLAYNKADYYTDNEENESPEALATLVGDQKVKRGVPTTYRLENGFAAQWVIEDEQLATLQPLSTNEVELVGKNKGWVTLTCIYQDQLAPAKHDENQLQTLTKEIMIY